MCKIHKLAYAMPVSYLRLKTNRSLLKYILLAPVTLFIYPIVVMSGVSTDINLIASRYDGKKTMHYCLMSFLVAPITLFIGWFVWNHKLSGRIGSEISRRNIPYSIGSGSFWGWNILGSLIIVGPFIYIHKILKAMNLLSADFNKKGI